MKKTYKKPMVEIEVYTLDASIASNCTLVVSNGPEEGIHKQCEDYEPTFPDIEMFANGPHNVSFYEDTQCDCYTSGGNGSYWTS